jgi:hypothetical protein
VYYQGTDPRSQQLEAIGDIGEEGTKIGHHIFYQLEKESLSGERGHAH